MGEIPDLISRDRAPAQGSGRGIDGRPDTQSVFANPAQGSRRMRCTVCSTAGSARQGGCSCGSGTSPLRFGWAVSYNKSGCGGPIWDVEQCPSHGLLWSLSQPAIEHQRVLAGIAQLYGPLDAFPRSCWRGRQPQRCGAARGCWRKRLSRDRFGVLGGPLRMLRQAAE